MVATQSPYFTVVFTFGVVRSRSFSNCTGTCIHHYDIVQNSSTDLKVLCVLPVYSSLPPTNPLSTTDLFPASIVLLFPDSHRVGIKHCVASADYLFFLDYLFLLSKVHLNFLCVFSQIDGSLLFGAE